MSNVPNASSGGSNNTLFFIVGGLVVVAGLFIFLFANGYIGGDTRDVNVTVEAPAAEPATPAPAAPAAGGTTTTP